VLREFTTPSDPAAVKAVTSWSEAIAALRSVADLRSHSPKLWDYERSRYVDLLPPNPDYRLTLPDEEPEQLKTNYNVAPTKRHADHPASG